MRNKKYNEGCYCKIVKFQFAPSLLNLTSRGDITVAVSDHKSIRSKKPFTPLLEQLTVENHKATK